MIRKELTLEANYVANWGLDEGIREFVSNAFDAQIEHDAVAEINHRRESNKLIITTKGATLSREVLLFGHSSKTGRNDLIGQFGEGLKLGSLACVRAGHPVTIRTGSEVWKPVIVASRTYNANVLAVEITTGHKEVERVSVEIENITDDMWRVIRRQFLALCNINPEEKIYVPYSGAILLNPEYKGKVFVKGISVRTDSNLQYGYDFIDIQVDRDRKMVSSWDLEWHSRQMWASAVNRDSSLREIFTNLAASSSRDLVIDSPDYIRLSDDVVNDIADAFIKENGEMAFPVSCQSEVNEVEFYGKTGIVVPKSYLSILEKKLGNMQQLKESFKFATDKKYKHDQLTTNELNNLLEALQDVKLAIPGLYLDIIDISSFRDERIRGLFHRDTGRIELSKDILSDLSETRIVLVHEATHIIGGDGTKTHEDAQCVVWSIMFDALKSKT